MTNNPYQAPTSDVSQQGGNQTYQPKILTANGRIGRLRYLAYSLVGYAFLIPGMAIMALAGFNPEEPSVFSGIGGILLLLGYLALIVYVFILAKRRFNDLDKTGWMSLLLIIPLVNLVIGLWLIFGSGTSTANQFGPMPVENPLSVKIFGLLLPILVFVIGILAAISIPAYQDYVERANSAQESFIQE